MLYANLPGIQVSTLDGGLTTVQTPKDRKVLILGTSAIGPANEMYEFYI